MKRAGTTWLPKVHLIGAKLRHVVKPIRVGDSHIEPHFQVEEDKLDYCCWTLAPSRTLQKLCRIRRSGIVNTYNPLGRMISVSIAPQFRERISSVKKYY